MTFSNSVLAYAPLMMLVVHSLYILDDSFASGLPSD